VAIREHHGSGDRGTSRKEAIWIRDEIRLVGRLITRDGNQQNKPVVRFGHLAMMDDAIKRDGEERQRSFLIECRSVSGFSGSPVFVNVTDPIAVATNRRELVWNETGA